MSPFLAILVVAGLFAAFGWLQRGQEHRQCHGCTSAFRGDSCSSCPLHEVGHD